MPPLVDFGVIVALDFAVGFGRYYGGCAARIEVLSRPIRIERLVRAQGIACNAFDQRRDAFHVMRLPQQKQEPNPVTERIHQGHDLGCQPAAGAPNGLSLSPPFAPVAF